jgi:hypothetical protein
MDKQMQLGLHTYTLHLWGLGQNWGIVAEPRPKEMNLLQLMDKAVEWGLDGLHITGCDSRDQGRCAPAGGESRRPPPATSTWSTIVRRDEEFDPRLTDGVEDGHSDCRETRCRP